MAASPRALTILAPILLRLYPRGWRARYERELLTVLEEGALTPSATLDIALAALDAHLNGDYPSGASEDRKVRRPMLDRLAPLAIVLGGVFLTFFAIAVVVGDATSLPEDDPVVTVLFYVVPFAIGLLALGISGVSVTSLGHDRVARGLGLLTAALGLGLATAITYLFFVSDIGWDIIGLLIPSFALASGLLGLRLLANGSRARAQGLLLIGGLIAAGAWVVGAVMTANSSRVSVADQAAAIETLGFGILFVAWVLVGLLELRGKPVVAAT